MITFVLAIHLILALVLIVVVLLQPGKGGGMALGGGAQNVLDSAGVSTFFNKVTMVIAAMLFATSIILAMLAKSNLSGENDELLNGSEIPQVESSATVKDNMLPSTSDIPQTPEN